MTGSYASMDGKERFRLSPDKMDRFYLSPLVLWFHLAFNVVVLNYVKLVANLLESQLLLQRTSGISEQEVFVDYTFCTTFTLTWTQKSSESHLCLGYLLIGLL